MHCASSATSGQGVEGATARTLDTGQDPYATWLQPHGNRRLIDGVLCPAVWPSPVEHNAVCQQGPEQGVAVIGAGGVTVEPDVGVGGTPG